MDFRRANEKREALEEIEKEFENLKELADEICKKAETAGYEQQKKHHEDAACRIRV